MKFVNPLAYPLAVLAGGIVLIAGGRLAKQPPWIVLPLALVVTTGGAFFLHSREPEKLHLNDPALERELLQVKQSAQLLAERAEALRQEASRFLVEAAHLELLIAVQYACDRTAELPGRIQEIARRMDNTRSLLSVTDLQKQLDRVLEKQRTVTSVAGKEQFHRLAESLRRNMEIAREGQDSRYMQVANLTQWVTESAGILQKMQNKIRAIGISGDLEIAELGELSAQLNAYQENVAFLTTE